jgi:predicted transglutaminase-like protease
MLLGNFSARWVLAFLISFGEKYYFRNKIQCFITKPSEKCLNRISQLIKAGKKMTVYNLFRKLCMFRYKKLIPLRVSKFSLFSYNLCSILKLHIGTLVFFYHFHF